jgi:hypothetical protein
MGLHDLETYTQDSREDTRGRQSIIKDRSLSRVGDGVNTRAYQQVGLTMGPQKEIIRLASDANSPSSITFFLSQKNLSHHRLQLKGPGHRVSFIE